MSTRENLPEDIQRLTDQAQIRELRGDARLADACADHLSGKEAARLRKHARLSDALADAIESEAEAPDVGSSGPS